MAGRFTASGGNITAGARDLGAGRQPRRPTSAFTGTYTQAANGRALLTLTTAANNNLRGLDGQSDARTFRGQ